MKNKVFSVALVLIMLISMIPMASAEELDTSITANFEEGAVVSNYNSATIPMITFGADVDMSTVDAADFVVTQGTASTVGTIDIIEIASNVRGIDISKLLCSYDSSYTAQDALYTLTISGVSDTTGAAIADFVTTFTISYDDVAHIAYEPFTTVNEIAHSDDVDITYIHNRSEDADFIKTGYAKATDDKMQNIIFDCTKYSTMVLDFGTPQRIDGIAFRTPALENYSKISFLGTNVMLQDEKGWLPAQQESATLLGQVTDTTGYMPIEGKDRLFQIPVSDNNEYRYLVCYNGANYISLSEIFVYQNNSLIKTNFADGAVVTNQSSKLIPTVTFGDGVDFSDAVYTIEYDLGSKSATMVTLSENTKGIDISNLVCGYASGYVPQAAAYTLKISGLKDASGNALADFTKDFKIGYDETYFVPYKANTSFTEIAHDNGNVITYVHNRAVAVDDSSIEQDFNHIVDDKLQAKVSDCKYYTTIIVDFGTAKKIDAIAMMTRFDATNYVNYNEVTFLGTNELATDENGYIKKGSEQTGTVLAAVADKNSYFTGNNEQAGMYAFDVTDTGSYRYLVMYNNTNYQNITELFVYQENAVSTVKTEDVTVTADIQNGTKGLTNVKNSKVFNVDNKEDVATYRATPITLTFPENVDMSTVTASSVVLKKSGVNVNYAYAPVIDADAKTMKIDIANCDAYSYGNGTRLDTYTIEVTSDVKTTENVSVTPEEVVSFTTGAIAKMPYVAGKEIRDVANDKSARTETVLSGIASEEDAARNSLYAENYAPGFVDSYIFNPTKYGTNALVDINANALLIDLGNKYTVSALAWYSTRATTAKADWYVLDAKTYETEGLTPVHTNAQSAHLADSVGIAATTGRYLLIVPTEESATKLYDVQAYAYFDVDAADVYMRQISRVKKVGEEYTTEEVLHAYGTAGENNQLVIVEYDEDSNKMIKAEFAAGNSSTPTMWNKDNCIYKAFIWDSLENCIPLTDAVIC